jgi:hypothetical protein
MNTRAIRLEDLPIIEKLHERYHSRFEFPGFGNMLNAFVIEDDNQDIILACAIEKVAEGMLVTDLSKNRIVLGKALVEALRCAEFTCIRHGIRDLYAFVDLDSYAKHLKQHGFIETDRPLKLRIPHG